MFVVIALGVVPELGSTPCTSDPYCVWRERDGSLARWPHTFEPTHWCPLPCYSLKSCATSVKFSTQSVGRYTNVTVRSNDVSLELGLLNSSECKELAAHLREVADDLSPEEAENDQPSLAEQAFDAAKEISDCMNNGFVPKRSNLDIINAALKRLQELENNDN